MDDNIVTMGNLRPSQIISVFGPGSIVDTIKDSVTILDIDLWKLKGKRIKENRLSSYLGVEEFFVPKTVEKQCIPVVSFPYMHVCSKCNTVFDIREDFDLEDYKKYGPICFNCKSISYPSRFITVCENGHMDDFPWEWWVHNGNSDCKGKIKLYSFGNTSTLSDMLAKCELCGAKRNMSGAIQMENFSELKCSGHHPFKNINGENDVCDKKVIPCQRGASNVYFPVVRSAISIPTYDNSKLLYEYIEKNLETIKLIKEYSNSAEDYEKFLKSIYRKVEKEYTRSEFDKALENLLKNIKEFQEIKEMEYKAIINHSKFKNNKMRFKAEEVIVDDCLKEYFSRIIKITRLREVRVLLGFTRVDVPDPDAETTNIVKLNKKDKSLPAVEVNGEGIFIEFNRDKLNKWINKAEVIKLTEKYANSYKKFCDSKGWEYSYLKDATYVLMHTFSHLLIKQMSISSGYSSTAIKERIYFNENMSGVLIYTGSSDKEGSLGGLVELGDSDKIMSLMEEAFQEAMMCANDPECMLTLPSLANSANSNGSACYSCCMISETSCENGNRLLDRSLVIPLNDKEECAYFKKFVKNIY